MEYTHLFLDHFGFLIAIYLGFVCMTHSKDLSSIMINESVENFHLNSMEIEKF